ncbi:MAG: hypothetical protein K2W95_10050 [Candidatus Obscuribacterales bacterium]|nr:hypothetical protein [Candidatus Obscuribacterales bacterium]
MQNNELDYSDEGTASFFEDAWAVVSHSLDLTPSVCAADRKIRLPGVLEAGQIIFDAVIAARQSTAIPEEGKAQRTNLVGELEKRFGNNPEKFKELKAKLEQLEKGFVTSTDENLRRFPQTLTARYSHLRALVQADCSPEVIAQAIDAKLDATAIALDVSGKYTNKFKAETFPEPKNWLYSYRRLTEDGSPTQSPRAEEEAKRVAEIWQAQITSDDAEKRSVITVSRNGERIESWVIDRSAGDNATFKMQGIEGPDPKEDIPQLRQAREKLFTSILRSGLKPDEQMEMIRDLTQMESRARTGAFEKANQGALAGTRGELARTYTQLNRLFSVPDEPNVPNHKLIVARQLARELGDPGDIDQGQTTDACRIATVQYRLATIRPSVVAKVVVDGLIDGKVTAGGETFDFDKRNRQPSSPQATEFPRPANERSLASQIFQLAAMNTMGRDRQVVAEHMYYVDRWTGASRPIPDNFKPPYTRLEFVQTPEMHEGEAVKGANGKLQRGNRRKREAGDPHPALINNGMTVVVYNDRGERLPLTSTEPGKERKDGGNHILLQAYASQTLLDKLDPGNHQKCVFAHSGMTLYTRDKNIVPDRPGQEIEKVVSFDGEVDFRQNIIEAKKSGNLPIIIASRDYSMGGAYSTLAPRAEMESALEECHNTHIMIIRDYVPADPARGIKEHLVTDDFFGKNYDRRILPTHEWSRYFMNMPDTQPPKKQQ